MKIAFLHMTMGIINRGSEISTDILATELSKNHKVLIIGSGQVGSKSYEYHQVKAENKSFYQAPANIFQKIKFRLYLDEQSRQIKLFTKKSLLVIKKFNPDIIIPINGKSQIKIVKKNFPNKKIILFGRAGIGWNDADSLSTNPDLFIALSPRAKEWAKNLASEKTEITHIPNPLDIEKFQSSISVKVNLSKPIVLVVGALTKYKNIDLVIKAVAKTNASLLILGKGEEEKRLKALADKLLPGRHMLSSCLYEKLPSYFKTANIFCFMPDSQEAFGRVYIEAMAAGLPVVAPNDRIRKDIVGSQGFYTDHQVKNIVKAIEKALSIGRVDYSDELKKFSSKKIVKKIEKEFNSLLINSHI